jgi:hypothetical protein
MNPSEILDPIPVNQPEAILAPVLVPRPAQARRPTPMLRLLLGTLGWAWRIGVGVLCCMSYASAVLLVGWLNRLVQGWVMYAWYRRSPLRPTMSFAEFRAGLGPDAPVLRPRWALRESFARAELKAELQRPTPDGDPPGWARQLFRLVTLPFASFFANLKMGVLGVLATFLLAGWGAALMTFSWEFGWLNSFTKGYEVAFVGPLTGLAGLLLFSAAMLYVPMAQAHLAVTGDFRAFFDFRFVWRLIRARLTAYVVLAALFVGFGLVQEILKTLPVGLGEIKSWREATAAELYTFYIYYYLGSSAWLFLALLVTRLMGGWIYGSAVLKVLRKGRVTRAMLHPRLADWLDRLALVPQPEPTRTWPVRALRAGGRWTYRRLLFPALFLLWVAFVMRVYVGEFFHYHPVVGFLNHPLVLVPCVNYIPPHLAEAVRQEQAEMEAEAQ